jgi:hypothetical protein
MGFAEFIIARAFARPVGSTHPTPLIYRRRFSLRHTTDKLKRQSTIVLHRIGGLRFSNSPSVLADGLAAKRIDADDRQAGYRGRSECAQELHPM